MTSNFHLSLVVFRFFFAMTMSANTLMSHIINTRHEECDDERNAENNNKNNVKRNEENDHQPPPSPPTPSSPTTKIWFCWRGWIEANKLCVYVTDCLAVVWYLLQLYSAAVVMAAATTQSSIVRVPQCGSKNKNVLAVGDFNHLVFTSHSYSISPHHLILRVAFHFNEKVL